MSDLIKREDAIEVIDTMICDNKWVCECAINSLPTAEPQGELISKVDAVAIVLMCSRIFNLSEQEKWDKCAKSINSLSPIDAEWGVCTKLSHNMKVNDYCSCGEREAPYKGGDDE